MWFVVVVVVDCSSSTCQGPSCCSAQGAKFRDDLEAIVWEPYCTVLNTASLDLSWIELIRMVNK